MRNICILTISLLFTTGLAAQKNNREEKQSGFLTLDKNGKPCKAEKATYLVAFHKLNDTTYQWKNYFFKSHIISIETFRDRAGSIPNGLFSYYDEQGKIDSMGYAFNGKRNKTWYFYDDSLKIILKKKYQKGILISTEKPDDEENTDLEEDDKLQEASYKKGNRDWQRYIRRGIKEALMKAPSAEGTVYISFQIGQDGSVLNVNLLQSVEYSLDIFMFNRIKESPKWIPAYYNGEAVDAFRIQPITIVGSR